MDADTEIDIENIESEICAGREPVSEAFAIFGLFLIAEIETEHAERHMERDILHDKHLEAGREIQLRLHICGMGVSEFSIIRSLEIGATRAEGELHLVIDAEATVPA